MYTFIHALCCQKKIDFWRDSITKSVDPFKYSHIESIKNHPDYEYGQNIVQKARDNMLDGINRIEQIYQKYVVKINQDIFSPTQTKFINIGSCSEVKAYLVYIFNEFYYAVYSNRDVLVELIDEHFIFQNEVVNIAMFTNKDGIEAYSPFKWLFTHHEMAPHITGLDCGSNWFDIDECNAHGYIVPLGNKYIEELRSIKSAIQGLENYTAFKSENIDFILHNEDGNVVKLIKSILVYSGCPSFYVGFSDSSNIIKQSHSINGEINYIRAIRT